MIDQANYFLLNDFIIFKEGGECLVEAARLLKCTFAYALNVKIEKIDEGFLLYLDWMIEFTQQLHEIINFDLIKKWWLEEKEEKPFNELKRNVIEKTQVVRKCIEIILNYMDNE